MRRPKPTSIPRSHKMRFGAEVRDDGTRFRIWAPKVSSVKLKFKGKRTLVDLNPRDDGWHRAVVEDVGAGTLYKYVLPDGSEIPDPTSRFQPDDIHGYSEVIDPRSFAWTDVEWIGRPWEEAIIYELHIGTFTDEGTFSAAIGKLDHLVKLGVTAIQIMPIAEFYGKFNWGYDGAMWFAPDSSYGRPGDLKAFINAAHARSLMVFLDVVYNHLGSQGNYLVPIAPIFTKAHESPWGEAINFDGKDSKVIRELVVESALYWTSEFNLDGLRFDAVHAITDDSSTHILELLAARLRSARPHRYTHLIIENSENQERWLRRNSGSEPVHFTAQWNDDVHHLLHSAATGENTGYYADFDNLEERCDKLGRALAEGFAYQGELKIHEGVKRGEPSSGLPATSFVAYMQDHDQVGNRVRGDRINQLAHIDAVKALTAVYLLLPQIPMLFMGEEWATERPFPFFSDVPAELRDIVRKGRQEELKSTPEHDDPSKPNVEEAVDPTSLETFQSAKLDWKNLRAQPHADWLLHYRSLIDVRKMEIIPRLVGQEGFASEYEALGPKAVLVSWRMGDGSKIRLYANLSDDTQSDVPAIIGRRIYLQGFIEEAVLGPWSVLWTIEI
ncbi:1,4-alpha-glucan branching protein [Devosia soli]|uniref:Malto-oligosyltrehalose trehalohydrolase n=1 Tax=Devosia soli TaxID=361041 RepID=A0A0F5LF30_9HYPH|nr:malto-oligosyltrehalose trehalohydrolase [Devosia soli]KKB80958.1 1,4-alpha-glucan branching protein [Devosia soli]